MGTSKLYDTPFFSASYTAHKEIQYLPERDMYGNMSTSFTITLPTTWSSNTGIPYTQTVLTGNSINTNNNPVIDIVINATDTDYATKLKDWNKVVKAVTTDTGITFYATEPTTVALTLKVMVV